MDFSDVTLVCEDDHQIEAHKIILSACSPFFSTVLKRNKHSHPLVYMKGLKANDLAAIMDFIYLGEANIYQEDLDAFLAVAEDLQLKGLTGNNDATEDAVRDESKKQKQLKPQSNPNVGQEEYIKQSLKSENTNTSENFKHHPIVPVDAGKGPVPLNANKEDIKAQLESMMVKAEHGEIKFICTTCGKTTTGKNWGSAKFNMRGHIETHLEGLSYPCNQCGNVSR